MTDNSLNKDSNEDKLLNALIREARTRRPEKFKRPSEDVIINYVMGSASEEEKDEMMDTLAYSARFRREIVEMTKGIKEMENPKILKKIEKKRAEVPERVEQSKKSIFHDFIEKIKFLGRWKVYIPAVATAAIAFILLFPLITQKDGELSLVMSNIDPPLLIPLTTKSAAEDMAYDNPQDAALGEIRFLVVYENQEFELNPVIERSVPEQPYREMTLIVQDNSGKNIDTFEASIPGGSEAKMKEIMAWILFLPSRTLYNMKLTKDSVTIIWQNDLDDKGCLTITYPYGNNYKAIKGFTFSAE